MEIRLEDFENGRFYGFETENIEIYGTVVSKLKMEVGSEDEKHEEHILMVAQDEGKEMVNLGINDIKRYWLYDKNEGATEVKMFDEELLEYDVLPGERVDNTFRKITRKWEEFDEDTKNLLLKKVARLMSNDVLSELLDAYVKVKKYADDEHERYMNVIDNQIEFLERYEEFKKTLEPGYAKLYDTALFEVCGLKLGGFDNE